MVTPLRGRDELDLPGLERLIEHILDDRTRMVAKDNGGYPVKWMIERDGIALLNTRFPTEHHAAEFWEQHSTEYQL